MVFICMSLCSLDVENLLWISHLYGRRKEHRNTQKLDRMLTKKKLIYSLINYQSDFSHLRTHSITWCCPRMSSYLEHCTQ